MRARASRRDLDRYRDHSVVQSHADSIDIYIYTKRKRERERERERENMDGEYGKERASLDPLT